MNKNEIENHMKTILAKTMSKSPSGSIPKASNAGFNTYNEAWATVVSVDIRGFKNMAARYHKWATIKMMQAFTSTIIKISKENPNFISAYVNGDEVISCFSANLVSKINTNVNTVIKINSAINILFPRVLLAQGYNAGFEAGIGVWTSDKNSLVKYGEKGTSDESFSTLVGESINFASTIGKVANKNGNEQIIMNDLTYNNIKGEETAKYLSSLNLNVGGTMKTVWQSSVRYTDYNEEA